MDSGLSALRLLTKVGLSWIHQDLGPRLVNPLLPPSHDCLMIMLAGIRERTPSQLDSRNY